MRALIVVGCAILVLPAAAKKGGGKRHGDSDMAGAQAAIQKTLSTLSDKMSGCAEAALAPDLAKLDIAIRATLNGDGQVMTKRVTVDGGAADDARIVHAKACAEGVLATALWPRLTVALYTVERTYSYQRGVVAP